MIMGKDTQHGHIYSHGKKIKLTVYMREKREAGGPNEGWFHIPCPCLLLTMDIIS